MQTSCIKVRGRRRISKAIDITPLIDVVFQLLLFFMLTGALASEHVLNLSLPTASTKDSIPPKSISIEISADKTIALDGAVIPIEELSAKLEMLAIDNAKDQVIVKSDKTVDVSTLVSVMDKVKEKGVANLGLATTE